MDLNKSKKRPPSKINEGIINCYMYMYFHFHMDLNESNPPPKKKKKNYNNKKKKKKKSKAHSHVCTHTHTKKCQNTYFTWNIRPHLIKRKITTLTVILSLGLWSWASLKARMTSRGSWRCRALVGNPRASVIFPRSQFDQSRRCS